MKTTEARKMEKEAFAKYQAALKVCNEALRKWVLSVTVVTDAEVAEFVEKQEKPTNN